MTPPNVLDTALDLAGHGLSVVPVAADGSKRPHGAWKRYQDTPATETEIRSWYPTGSPLGLGIVTGEASRNLIMFEIEGHAAHRTAELRDLADQTGLTTLWQRLGSGWLELSPSGGMHWFAYLDHPAPGNTKYAQAPDRTTVAESRGTGGFVVAAPSAGAVHPTGKPWTRAIGGPHTAPTLTTSEREAVEGLFRSLNQYLPPDPTPATGPAWNPEDGRRPGDDAETLDWAEILAPHGWTHVATRGRTRYWKRPGKTTPGFSATTGHADDRDRLWVFSSSTEFETETPYTKFGAIAVLHHGGNHEEAARALADGKHYGRSFGEEKRLPITPPDVTVVPGQPPFQIAPQGLSYSGGSDPKARNMTAATEGTAALATVVDLNQRRAAATTDPYLHSDDANGVRFVQAHAHQARYATEWGRWLVWTGTHWRPQDPRGGRERELAKQVARALPETDKDDRRHKKYTQSAVGISNMLTMARTDPAISISIDQLDNHPWELNTPDGILDLRTGILGPHNPNHLHTKTTTTSPDPDADATVWESFLATTFPGNPGLVQYMQRLVGYSVVGEVREHVLPFAHGNGGNGKGVFLETIAGVLGDYATIQPAGFLMASKFQQHATELAELQGRRFVICSEVNEHDRWDEGKVKQLTGGDTVKARFMRQDFFAFKPTHHLWIMGNHQPDVESGGDSFWRRLRLIPFTHKVADEDKVEDLQGILAREYGPAVLAWIARGAADYHRHGLQEPDQVKAATKEYAANVDTVGRFLDEDCLLGPHFPGIPTTRLRHAYETWCTENGERPVTGRAFATHLSRHGVAVGANAPRTEGQRMYGGVALRANDDDQPALDGDRGGY